MSLEFIGTPLAAVKIFTAVYTQEAEGYRIYTVAQGEPCKLYIIDALAGQCLESFELQGSTHSWGMCVQTDGSVYIGGDGYLYRYDHKQALLENCGLAIPGETYFWRIAAGEDGMIYGGTYPGGKVFQYDPKAKRFHDFGSMVPGEKYARSIDTGAEHKIYVGIGTQQASIIELDTRTGLTRELPIPEGQENNKLVYDLDVFGGKLFVRYMDTQDLMVYDLEKEQWVARIDRALGFDVSPPGDGREVYLIRDGYLHSFHLDTYELKPTSFAWDHPCCDFGWIDLDDADYPGQSLISMYSGGYWVYNPVTHHAKHVPIKLDEVPVKIQTLAAGSEGTLYIGGYFTGGLSSYDVTARKFAECQVFGQPEGMHWFNSKLYLGVYPGGRIYEYDPERSWKLGVNPKEVFSLKQAGQDRPFAITSTGERLAIGTVPTYGKLGGALTFYDPATGEHEVHGDVVHGQSVIALCHHKGFIYGGTSVYGGLGITPIEEHGTLFVWDVAAKKKVWEGVPILGERAISALTVGEDGSIWGLTSGHLFQFDPVNRRFVLMIELFNPLDWTSVPHFWRGCYVTYDSSGSLFGNCIGRLFRYDLKAKKLEVLATDVQLFARDHRGDLYVSKCTDLYKFKVSKP